VTEIDFAYFNYAHGGRKGANSAGDGGAYDFTGLVRVIGHENRWPDVLIMGEADRYDFNGGEGLWGAVAAMADAKGPAYTPFVCSLPRQWGPFAPAIFVNTQKLRIHRFYDHRLPDFAARRRNVLEARIPGRNDLFRVATGHGDLSGGDQRLADARMFRMLVHPEPCIIGMDWNSVLSGPQWEPADLDDQNKWPHLRMMANRIYWQHGAAQIGPYRADTRALDYLCGYWFPPHPWWHWRRLLRRADARLNGQRLGGIGFHWVGELAEDYSPTTRPQSNDRQRLQIDGFVVNDPWRDRIVPDSFCVQDDIDPDEPDSDHLVTRVAIDI
jgi:hypothetical protein